MPTTASRARHWRCIICTNTKLGGDGWFGTVGAGYDWQFKPVVGVRRVRRWPVRRHEGSRSRISASASPVGKDEQRWAVGARLGYLVAPNVLSYVNAGYTGTLLVGQHLADRRNWHPVRICTPTASTRGGWLRRRRRREQPEHLRHQRSWLVHEDRISSLPISATRNVSELFDGTNLSNGRDINFKPLGEDDQHRRWSTASTGVARSLRSTDLC